MKLLIKLGVIVVFIPVMFFVCIKAIYDVLKNIPFLLKIRIMEEMVSIKYWWNYEQPRKHKRNYW